jgi:hypothetical protein
VPTKNLDHAELAEIASETGYRLKVELGRNPSSIPSHLERLVRALSDAPATRLPAFVPPQQGRKQVTVIGADGDVVQAASGSRRALPVIIRGLLSF